MFGIFFEKDLKYESGVFAVHHKGFLASVFIVDKNKNIIEKELYILKNPKNPESRLKQVGYIREVTNTNNWIYDKNYEGYDWFLSNKEYIESVRNNKPLPKEIRDKILLVNDEILTAKRDENTIRKDNLESINVFFNHFDWSEIIDYKYNKENKSLELKLNCSLGFKLITLTFHNVGNYNLEKIILSHPSFIFEGEKIYFVEWQHVKNSSKIEKGDVFVEAESISFSYEFI